MSDFISFGTSWFSADWITVILMAGFVAVCLAWFWWDKR